MKSLDQVLLKLPAVRIVFLGCRSVFNQMDSNGDGTIKLAEFQASALQRELQLDEATLRGLYAQADLDHDNDVQFKEFVVLLVLAWLLRSTERAEGSLALLDKAMQTLVDAFHFFDRANRGWITQGDVQKALGTEEGSVHSRVTVAPDAAVGQRFSEMDFSKDGRVTFPEFVLALESWADLDEE